MKTIPASLRHALAFTLKLFEPPADVKVWQWAEQYRRLNKDVTAVPGRYSTSTGPYQREPQES